MKKFAMLCCVLLASMAMAVPRVQSEFEKRIQSGAATKILVAGGAIVSASPQLLRIRAQSFAYRYGGSSGAFGRTVLKGGERASAIVMLVGNKRQAPVEITAPEIEVETVLTEIQIYLPDVRPSDFPWKDLAAALVAAPHSPRFYMEWYEEVLSTRSFNTIIYDRRNGNLYHLSEYISMASMEVQGFRHSTDKNVTDQIIEKRAAQDEKSTPE